MWPCCRISVHILCKTNSFRSLPPSFKSSLFWLAVLHMKTWTGWVSCSQPKRQPLELCRISYRAKIGKKILHHRDFSYHTGLIWASTMFLMKESREKPNKSPVKLINLLVFCGVVSKCAHCIHLDYVFALWFWFSCPKMTVKKTLSEFRRTHHDNWQEHRQCFTDDQLLVLTDLLVSPCYYA